MSEAILFDDILQMINRYGLTFARISGFFLIAPIFGSSLISVRIRLLLALTLTVPLAALVEGMPMIDVLSIAGGIVIAQQLMLGLIFGFVFLIVTQAFIIGGQLLAMQAGLGFASMIDPQSGVSVPVLSQFYLLFVTLIFLAMDGHLLFISLLAKSFTAMPVHHTVISGNIIWVVVSWTKWMFSAAVVMVLPGIIALLLANFALGVLTRAAPQLNIFAVGFPATLTLGLFISFVTLPSIMPYVESLYTEAFKTTEIIMEMK